MKLNTWPCLIFMFFAGTGYSLRIRKGTDYYEKANGSTVFTVTVRGHPCIKRDQNNTCIRLQHLKNPEAPGDVIVKTAPDDASVLQRIICNPDRVPFLV